MIVAATTRYQGQALGVIPLAIPIGISMIGAGLWWRGENQRQTAVSEAMFPAPSMPPPPPAPQTAAELTTWTPETMYDRYAREWSDWTRSAIPASSGSSSSSDDPLRWVLILGGVLAIILLVKR